MTTKAERDHMGRVASLGCYLCRHLGYGPTPAQVHNLREGQGMGQLASAWLTVRHWWGGGYQSNPLA